MNEEIAITRVIMNVDGVSDRVLENLADKFETPQDIVKASSSKLQTVEGIGPQIAGRISRRTRTAKNNPCMAVELYVRDKRKWGRI